MKNPTIPIIEWANLKENHPSEEGTYLVGYRYTPGQGKKALKYSLAEWREAGDTVNCTLLPSKTEEIMKKTTTPAERLLASIFINDVKVPETGFYIKYLLEDEELLNEHPGYMEWYECIGKAGDEDVFWSYLPVPPEGYTTSYDSIKEFDSHIKDQYRDNERDLMEACNNLTDKGGRAHDFYKAGLIKMEKCLDTDGSLNINGFAYKNNDHDIQKVSVIADYVTRALDDLINRPEVPEYAPEKVADIMKSGNKEQIDGFIKYIKSTSEKYSFASEEVMWCKRMGISYSMFVWGAYVHPRMDPDMPDQFSEGLLFDIYLNKILPKYPKCRNIPKEEACVIASNLLKADCRLNRLIKLINEKAPGHIIDNEKGLVIESLYYLLCDPIGKAEDFNERYAFMETDLSEDED